MLLLVGVIAATFAVNFFVLNATVMSSFVQLERDTAKQNAHRVMQAIQREAGFLENVATDWAFWTDTRDFVSGETGDYAEQNLMGSALVDLNVNTLFLIDNEGMVRWGMSIDLETEEEIDLTDLPNDGSWESHALLQVSDANEDSVFSGMIGTEKGMLAVASAPILTSDRQGPSVGTLVFGKQLSDSLLETLAQQTGVNFQLIEPGGIGSPGAGNDGDTPVVIESTNTVLNAYQVLRDTTGNPSSVIKTETPRDITKSGAQTLLTALVLLILAGVAVLITVVLRPGYETPGCSHSGGQ